MTVQRKGSKSLANLPLLWELTCCGDQKAETNCKFPLLLEVVICHIPLLQELTNTLNKDPAFLGQTAFENNVMGGEGDSLDLEKW